MPRYVPRYLGRLVAGIFAFGSPFVSSAQATAGARTARTGTDTTATDSLHGRNPISGASLAPMSARTNPFTVGQLSAENMPVPGLTSPLQSLDGKIAGVTVSQLTGAPGADVSLVLRTAFGPFNSAAPQIVVDGVWLNAAHPMTAQDIESLGVTNIEVLKGPVAAALYGYRGISGVVVVTTNRGRTLPLGETRLTVRSEVGPGLAGEFLQPLEAHPYRVNLAGQYVNAAGTVVTRSNRVLNAYNIAESRYITPTYNHADQLFRAGVFNTQTLSLEQNRTATNFNLSYARNQQPGIIPNGDGYQRQTLRVNADFRRSDWMRASISASHAQSSDDPSQVSFTGLATIDADVDLLLPDPSGVFKYIPIPDPTDPFANPLNQQRYPHSQIKRDRTLLNATVEFKLFPFLSVGGSGSYDRGNWHQFATIPKGTPTLSGQGSSSGSQQTARDTSNGSLLQAGATVQKTFGALQSRLALRAEKQQQTYSSFQRVGTSFNDQGVPQVNSETYSNNKVETSALIAKPMLDYSGKYVVEALLRREKPGGNFSHESFSRVSVAWLLNEEHWFPFSDLSLVKLHAAAGASTFHQNSQQYAQLDPSPPIGNPYSLALQDPGKTTEHEFGIAIAPRNRWQVSLVYATSNTKGASLAASTSPCIVCSASNPVANLAGHTAEATVQARILQRTKFTWDIALVGDRRRSTIEESLRTCYTDFLQRVCNNIDIGTMQGHHLARDKRELVGVQASSLGAFDINDEGYVVPVGSGNSFRDGKSKNLWGTNVTVDGRTFGWGLPMTAYDENGLQVESQIGDGNPDLQFGFQNNIQYRSLRLYAQIAGQFGGDVYNNRKQALYASGDHVDLDQSSKPDELRKSRSYYRALANGNADYLSNFVESATHARLAEASVGYEFKAGTSGLLKRIGASRVQVDLVGRNLFTITGYSGLNPMGSSAASREDNILYPLVRTFSLATIIVF